MNAATEELCADERPRTTSGDLGWSAFAAPLLFILLLLAARQRDWGPNGELVPWLGAAIAFLGLLPAIGWHRAREGRPGRSAGIPFLPFIGFLYALYFGFPVLLRDAFTTPSLRGSTESLERALWLALAGWLALLAGWRLSRGLARRVRPLHLPLDRARARHSLPWLLGIGFAATLLIRTVALPPGLVAPMHFVQTLFPVGIGILALCAFRGELSRTERLLLWLGLVPAYLFLQVGIGSVAQLAYASLFFLFLAWGAGERVPLLALGTLGLLVLLLRGHVHSFRAETWDDGVHAEAGVVERSFLFLEILGAELAEEGLAPTFERSADLVATRVAHIATFAHVVQMTPAAVPHWGGATYATLPSTLVPRAIWPKKPTKEVGQDFGHRYRLLAPSDRTTAMNLPQLVELYANFGAAGVALGMLALGALYRLFHRWWNTPGTGEGTLLVACVLFSRMILIESDFSLVFGAVLQYAVLLILLFRWLGPRRAMPQQPADEVLHAGRVS